MRHPTTFAHPLLLYVPLISGAAILPQARDTPSFLPHVTSVQYSGTGCPSSNPRVDETGAWDDLAFRLNGFEVTTQPGSSSRNVTSPAAAARTANCEVHLHVAGCQAGWQVAVHDVDVRGPLVLDPGAALDFYVQSYWSEKADDTVRHVFVCLVSFISSPLLSPFHFVLRLCWPRESNLLHEPDTPFPLFTAQYATRSTTSLPNSPALI
jgi:hypothetical protein